MKNEKHSQMIGGEDQWQRDMKNILLFPTLTHSHTNHRKQNTKLSLSLSSTRNSAAFEFHLASVDTKHMRYDTPQSKLL